MDQIATEHIPFPAEHYRWCGIDRICKHHRQEAAMPEAQLMKGQPYSKRFLKGKLRYTYPVIVEEKRDEIRAHFKLVRCKDSGKPVACEVLSYAGKPLYNLHKQCEFIYSILLREGLTELDCGVEVNESYDDTYRYVRSKNGVPTDLKDASVVVLLFDVPESNEIYENRLIGMDGIVGRANRPDFKRPQQWVARDQLDEDLLYAECRRQGIEGIMIKTPDHLYERSRSWSWFKRKPDETHDGVIVDLVEAVCGKDQPEAGLRVGDRLARTGSVIARLEDGSTAAPHGIPHNLGRLMHQNPEKYIGQWVEFSCMEMDRAGGYRHPVFKRLREAKA